MSTLQIVVTAIGVIGFLVHVMLAVFGAASAESSSKRLERIGFIVPGLSFLVVAVSPFVSGYWRVLLVAAAVLNLAIGRACYELLLLRKRE